MKKAALLLIFTALCVSCGNRAKTETITVASEKANIEGVVDQECFLIKHAGDQGWELWCFDIDGFTYEPGYEYVLQIRENRVENPAAGQTAVKYELVKQVSKVQKNSENMPPKRIIDEVKEGMEKIGDEVKEGAEKIGDKVKEGAEKIGDKVKEGAEKIGDEVRENVLP